MADNVLFCSQCGAQSTGGAGFCQKCGARLVPGTASPPPAPGGVYPAAAAAPYPPATLGAAVLPESYYGGFWIRVAAYLLDSLILSAVFIPLFLIFCLPIIMRVANQPNPEQGPPPELFGIIFMLVPIVWIVHWLYESLLTSSRWQGTVGKRILRLKVTDDFGNKITFARATGRFFAKILSGMVMYVGFIMVAFMERKRGLHDIICNTQVLRY
jgi:uncharacterized RDD family membrane protein YckC